MAYKSKFLSRKGVCSKDLNLKKKLTGEQMIVNSFKEELALNKKYYPEVHELANDYAQANKSPDWTVNQANYLKKFEELKNNK